jgi:hypothetical protein
MEPIEIQKRKFKQAVADERLVDEELAYLLDTIPPDSTVLEIGGIGFAAEYLSVNCNVVLCEEHAYSHGYRKHIVPDSTVQFLNLNPKKLNYSKPVYDYILVNDHEHMEIAHKYAIKGIVILPKKELIDVIRAGDEPDTEVQEEEVEHSVERSDIEPDQLSDF